jgi:hypothetical protein
MKMMGRREVAPFFLARPRDAGPGYSLQSAAAKLLRDFRCYPCAIYKNSFLQT